MRKALPSWSGRGPEPLGSSSPSKSPGPSGADASSRKIHSSGSRLRRCESRYRAPGRCDDVPRQRYRADDVPGRMPRSLEGHVAVVTGSTGEGMGRSTALTLAREGAAVVLNHGTNRTTVATNNRRIADAIQDLGARSIVVRANTAKGSEVRHMFARANAELGSVDILVNNAGGMWNPREDLAKGTDAYWPDGLPGGIHGMFPTIPAAPP